MALDYSRHVRSESARFLEVLRDVEPKAPVPSCPDWSTSDLLWHLTTVQAFWGRIVTLHAQSPEDVPDIERPASHEDVVAAFQHWSDYLATALDTASDAEAVWTWAPDRSVGFIRRRQAHEALIHRLDAELTTDSVTPLPAALAADGVLEALEVMYGGCPPWGTFTPDGSSVRIACTDTGDQIDVVLGRFSGTDPDDGRAHDEPDLAVGTLAGPPDAQISGTAEDLDAWLWHRRGQDRLAFEGSATVTEVLLTILQQPIT